MHRPTVSDRFARWILRHPRLLILATLVPTVAAAVLIATTPYCTSLLKTFTANSQEYEAFERRAEILGGHSEEVLYVATCEGETLFTPEKLNALRRAGRDIAALPEIAHVFTLADAPWLAPDRPMSIREVAAKSVIRRRLMAGEIPEMDERLRVPKYWPDRLRDQERVDLDAVKDAMLHKDPFTRFLLSKDGRCQTMLVRISRTDELSVAVQSSLRRRIEALVKKQGLGAQGVFSAGIVVMQGWTLNEATRSIGMILPLGALIICGLVYKIFRNAGIVILTLAIAGVAILWATGAAALAFGEITIMLSVVPLLVLTISTSDAIHLASAYSTEREAGSPADTALTKVLREVGGACVLTSITSLVGFVSLMVIPATAVRQLALATGVGVASALLLVLVFVPLGLARCGTSPGLSPKREFLPVNRWLQGFVRLCRHVSLKHPRATISVHLAVIVAAGIGCLNLKVDVDIPNRFASDHTLRRSVDFFNHQFNGTSTIEVFIESASGSLLQPRTIAALAEFEQRLSAMPEIQSVMSLPTVFRVAYRVLGMPSDSGLPGTEQAAVACIGLLEEAGSRDVRQIISQDRALTRMSIQVPPTRLMEVVRLSNEIEQIAKDVLPENVRADVSGIYPIIGRVVGDIIRGEYQGIAICFFCVMAIVALGARSIRLGLLAVLPNIFPLVLLGGLLAFTTEYVDCDILMVAILSFGLAVDDTIHFVHRYKTEQARGCDKRQALETTFDYTGQAIIRTTVVLGLGLAPFALSGYLSIWMLGTYVVFVLVSAVFADLLLLPALLLVFGRETPTR
ncbi:MAG: RND family transporter [Pirellulaceae bacterium]